MEVNQAYLSVEVADKKSATMEFTPSEYIRNIITIEKHVYILRSASLLSHMLHTIMYFTKVIHVQYNKIYFTHETVSLFL